MDIEYDYYYHIIDDDYGEGVTCRQICPIDMFICQVLLLRKGHASTGAATCNFAITYNNIILSYHSPKPIETIEMAKQ